MLTSLCEQCIRSLERNFHPSQDKRGRPPIKNLFNKRYKNAQLSEFGQQGRYIDLIGRLTNEFVHRSRRRFVLN